MIDFFNVGIQFTGEDLFTQASFKINQQDKIALVGANGSGKSTILKMLTGKIVPSDGKIVAQKNLKTGFLPQEFINTSSRMLFDEIKQSMSFVTEIESKEKLLHDKISNSADEEEKIKAVAMLGELDHQKHFVDYYTVDSQIEKVIMGLGFNEEEFTKPVNQFSGGWQMRIELAKILLGKNDILLMDEPTNHLDIESLQWLITYLQSYKGALLLVSHDKYFLNKLTNRTIEIYNRNVTFYNGNYEKYLDYKVQRDIQLRAAYENQERVRKQTEKFIERFRYKSTKAKQVQSRIKQLEKLETINLPDYESKIEIKFPPAPSSGSVPIEIQELAKNFPGKKVFEKVNLQLERGDKIAFVGPNGAGKTTLAKIIARELDSSEGTLKYGHNTQISYYAQEVADSLNMDFDMLDVISNASPDLTPGEIRNLLGSFLFSEDDVFKKIKVLSGGEKSRVALAKILVTNSNLIVLDEPTNHLDINSKEILQKALIDFTGTLIIVSHDVDFLRPIATKVFEIKEGHTKLYYGNIDYYLFKISEENRSTAVSVSVNNSIGNAVRKDQKRLEAEKRQQKYGLTKDLRKKIELLEIKIEELERNKRIIESELAKEEIYSNPLLAKEKNAEYDKIKKILEMVFSDWSELSEQLETIEQTFEN